MKRFFYLPISAFVFPEVAGAEAVFPSDGDVTGVFIGRSSYPTNITGTIPVNPVKDALILYSTPVVWDYQDGPSMDYPLVIEIPEDWVDRDGLTELKVSSLPEGVSAWAYRRTIFFNRGASMRYLFRSEAEKTQRIDSLRSYAEIKDFRYLESICGTIEQSGMPVVRLPNAVGDDISAMTSSLGVGHSRYGQDLLEETRSGACLGYAIACASKQSASPIRIDQVLSQLSVGAERDEISRVVEEVNDRCRQLEQLLSKGTWLEYSVQPMWLTTSFKFMGRDCLQLWSQIDSRLQRCVDFIAAYPRENWNWYGDEQRFVFMRELWNQVLQPSLTEYSQDVVNVFRDEVSLLCRHFKHPNEVEFSFENVRSPLLQAFCFALDCPRESERQGNYLKCAKRPDYCLVVFGALRGYAYFSRVMFPGERKTEPILPTAEPHYSRPRQKPVAQNPIKPPELPQWAIKYNEVLKEILRVHKVAPRSSEELFKSFRLAVGECDSEEKLLPVLSKKPRWKRAKKVFKDLSEKMAGGVPMSKTVDGGDLFERAVLDGDTIVAEHTDFQFIDDPELFDCLGDFLTRTLAMDKSDVDRLLENARFLQRGYACDGMYAVDPHKNPRDNKHTIVHYVNLAASRNPSLTPQKKEAILRFLKKRYR